MHYLHLLDSLGVWREGEDELSVFLVVTFARVGVSKEARDRVAQVLVNLLGVNVN